MSDVVEPYTEVRRLTESIAEPLTPEDQTVQTMPDVSPTKWHRAHVTWFFETFVLSAFAPAYEPFDHAYAYLFNSYYDAVGSRHPRPRRGLLSRPSCDDVLRYRQHVDRALLGFAGDGLPPDVEWLVELGLHHEQQHQELIVMDAKHVLGTNPLRPAYGGSSFDPTPTAGRHEWCGHPGGVVTIGHGGTDFAFDNETPAHEVLLEPFEVSSRLVTCGEWLEFMAAGGYTTPDLWMMEGWLTVQEHGWDRPLYWELGADGPMLYTLGDGVRPVDPDAPVVHVSWFEADAFARWAGCRLPTEQEWEAVAPPPGTGDGDWYGQVWQWTSSPYTAYPRFAPAPGAVGEYNGKFMVNQQVLRGSCCATPPGHARRTYRNFYPPSAHWPFCGLRLAR